MRISVDGVECGVVSEVLGVVFPKLIVLWSGRESGFFIVGLEHDA